MSLLLSVFIKLRMIKEYVTNIFINQLFSQILTEKRPMETVAIGAVSRVLETVGLSLFLTYWGTRTNPL